MSSIEDIRSELQSLRSIRGVENVFLAQRDGYPITSAGVWLSQDEIFGVSAAASAIFAVARRLHEKLSYALVEGDRAKFLVFAFPGDSRYFLSLTTRNNTNLGAIFQFINFSTENIRPHLAGEELLPPLRSFNSFDEESILESFDSTSWTPSSSKQKIDHHSFVLSESLIARFQALLEDFVGLLSGVRSTFVSLNGGYPIATAGQVNNKIGTLCAFTFSLFDTCRKVAWLTKRMRIDKVTLDYGTEHQFIYNAGHGLFSTVLLKDVVRLGYLRLLIPSFTSRIREELDIAARTARNPKSTQPLSRFLDGFLSRFISQSTVELTSK